MSKRVIGPFSEKDVRAFERDTPGISWCPPALENYLLGLHVRFRPRAIGLPKTVEELRSEAQRNVFNWSHILLILWGYKGPWTRIGVPQSLPVTLYLYQRVVFVERLRQKRRPLELRYKRRVDRIMDQIRGLSFFSEYDRQQILALLEQQKRNLISDVDARALYRRLGIERHPINTPLAGQSFWTPIVLQLVDYLKRASRQPDGQIFAMTARILHHASAGRYPDDAARVKQRCYREMD